MSQPPVYAPVQQLPTGTRARQRAETRERLFQTALAEFRRVGFASAQVDRIARAAGVVRGTFYFHFPTKDDVLLELARRITARVARRVAALHDSSPSLRQLLTRVNAAILDEHMRVGESGLLRDLLALYMRRPAELDLSGDGVPTLEGELSYHLAVLAGRGEIRDGLSLERLGAIILSAFFGIYARLHPGEELRRACDELIDLLVCGIGREC